MRQDVHLDQDDITSLVGFKKVYDGLNNKMKSIYEGDLTNEIYKIANEDKASPDLAPYYTNFDSIDIIKLNTFLKPLEDQQAGLSQPHSRRESRVPTFPQAVAEPSAPISSKVGKVAMFMAFVAAAAAILLLPRSRPGLG